MNATTNHNTQDTINDSPNLSEPDTVVDSLSEAYSIADDTPPTIEKSLDDTDSLDVLAPASPSEIDKSEPEQIVTPAPIAEVEAVVSPIPKAASVTPSENVTPETAIIAPTPATVAEPAIKQTPVESSPEPEPEPQTTIDDGYHPSFALKVFTILRHGIIMFFDIVLTGVAIVVEKLADINWAGLANPILTVFGQINEQIQTRLPRKFRLGLYGILLVLFLGLPMSVGAFSLFSGDKVSVQDNSSQIVAISQGSITTGNGILAPLFTPTVQFWATDIARWTANSNIAPDMFAVIMQLESCGNPTVEGGLFGIADANSTFNDPEADAPLALARLQNALTLSNNDFGMALAIYADGDSVLQNDFTTWSFHGRDMFILGRNFYYQAQQGMPSSPDLTSWMQNTGAILCTQAQTTLNG